MFLEIRGIKKSFGTGDSCVNVLKGLDLNIEKGEFCVLLGPSGSGKSTLLNIIGGIDAALMLVDILLNLLLIIQVLLAIKIGLFRTIINQDILLK